MFIKCSSKSLSFVLCRKRSQFSYLKLPMFTDHDNTLLVSFLVIYLSLLNNWYWLGNPSYYTLYPHIPEIHLIGEIVDNWTIWDDYPGAPTVRFLTMGDKWLLVSLRLYVTSSTGHSVPLLYRIVSEQVTKIRTQHKRRKGPKSDGSFRPIFVCYWRGWWVSVFYHLLP